MFASCTLLAQRRLARQLGLHRTTLAAATATATAPLWTTRRCGSTSAPAGVSPAASGKGNFFDFFKLPKHPELDGAALQKTYHNLQRLVHPDQQQVQAQAQEKQRQMAEAAEVPPAVAASNEPPPAAVSKGRGGPCIPEEGAKSSVDVSTYANAAYETLRSPYGRCRYLSRLVKAAEVKGSALTPAEEEELLVEDDRRTMQARDVQPDAPMTEEFLTELLAMNELIFGSEAEDEDVQRRWAVLRHDLEDRSVGYFQDAVKSWNAKDTANFHNVVREWTYVHNALNNLKERMAQ